MLCPTRELATQIDKQLHGLVRHCEPAISSMTVYGGGSDKAYLKQLKDNKPDVIVACPGRLLHMAKSYPKACKLKFIQWLVIDEADKMLEMGFLDDVLAILALLPPSEKRQHFMFSATMAKPVADLARLHMAPDTARVDTTDASAELQVAPNIDHEVYEVPDAWATKQRLLLALLKDQGEGTALVFCNTKAYVDHVAAHLMRSRMQTGKLHGEMTQHERAETMQRFRKGELRVLVATNVLARGIDVENIALVVNFDAAKTVEEYVHRVGRTARMGGEGRAITLLADKERPALRFVQRKLGLDMKHKKLEGWVHLSQLQHSACGDELVRCSIGAHARTLSHCIFAVRSFVRSQV